MRGALTTAWVADAPRVPTDRPNPLPQCRRSSAPASPTGPRHCRSRPRPAATAGVFAPIGAGVALVGSLTTGARALGPVAGAVYASLFGYVALLWTLAALAFVAAALAWRAEHAAASHPLTVQVAR
jgi:hypothetical protein